MITFPKRKNRQMKTMSNKDKKFVFTVIKIIFYLVLTIFFVMIIGEALKLAVAYGSLFILMLVTNFKEIIELAKMNPATYVLMLGVLAYIMLDIVSISVNIIIKCVNQIMKMVKKNENGLK